jgi:hypothetical protein
MADVDNAFEVEGGLVIDGFAGVITGEESPDLVEAPDGFVFLSATGMWQRRSGAWINVGGSGSLMFNPSRKSEDLLRRILGELRCITDLLKEGF